MEQRDERVRDPLLALGGGSRGQSLGYRRRPDAALGNPRVAGSDGLGQNDPLRDREPGEHRRAASQPGDGGVQIRPCGS